jgi:hypothetical protein
MTVMPLLTLPLWLRDCSVDWWATSRNLTY